MFTASVCSRRVDGADSLVHHRLLCRPTCHLQRRKVVCGSWKKVETLLTPLSSFTDDRLWQNLLAFIIVGCYNWNSGEILEKHILQELKRLWQPRNWRSSFDPNRNDQEPGEHPAHAGWGRHELWLVRLTHHYHFNETWINFVNFSPLFFSGMITSVSLAWEITTSNSTTLLIRFNLTWSTAAAENICF